MALFPILAASLFTSSVVVSVLVSGFFPTTVTAAKEEEQEDWPMVSTCLPHTSTSSVWFDR